MKYLKEAGVYLYLCDYLGYDNLPSGGVVLNGTLLPFAMPRRFSIGMGKSSLQEITIHFDSSVCKSSYETVKSWWDERKPRCIVVVKQDGASVSGSTCLFVLLRGFTDIDESGHYHIDVKPFLQKDGFRAEICGPNIKIKN